MISAVLVDDHTMVRQLLRDVLKTQGDMQVIADFADGGSLLAQIGTLRADIILMDIALGGNDGIDVVREMRLRGIDVPVLCLTMLVNEAVMRRAFEAGAAGFAVKHDAFEVLTEGIRTVAAGGTFTSPTIAEGVETGGGALLRKLSGREREIVSFVASGWTAAEIADHLSISERTVDYHRRNIAEKTGLRRIADITKFAVGLGLNADQ